jgi:hypothetical protein
LTDDDYYALLLTEWLSASRELREVLVEMEEYIEDAVERVARGQALFADPGSTPRTEDRWDRQRVLRDSFYARINVAQDAMSRIRAEATRRFIDDLGMTSTQVARLTDRSRQFTTRLYRTGQERRKRAEEGTL